MTITINPHMTADFASEQAATFIVDMLAAGNEYIAWEMYRMATAMIETILPFGKTPAADVVAGAVEREIDSRTDSTPSPEWLARFWERTLRMGVDA